MGSVSFPEVDDKAYRVVPATIDLSHNVLGRCSPLDALTRTMQVYGAAKALESTCHRTLVFSYNVREVAGADLSSVWEQAFGMPYNLSPTCALVTLAHATSTGQYVPDRTEMGRLGTALAKGLQFAQRMWLADRTFSGYGSVYFQSIDGLDYLMREMPSGLRPNVSAMLVPLVPRFVTDLADPKPYRPDVVATLIVRAGRLPGDARAQIVSIARGQTAGAQYARAVLSALPGANVAQPFRP